MDNWALMNSTQTELAWFNSWNLKIVYLIHNKYLYAQHKETDEHYSPWKAVIFHFLQDEGNLPNLGILPQIHDFLMSYNDKRWFWAVQSMGFTLSDPLVGSEPSISVHNASIKTRTDLFVESLLSDTLQQVHVQTNLAIRIRRYCSRAFLRLFTHVVQAS